MINPNEIFEIKMCKKVKELSDIALRKDLLFPPPYICE